MVATTSESTPQDPPPPAKPLEELQSVVIRFAGDSGDGMQLVGGQFTHVSAVVGNDVCTLPDYPAEIRAPAGTLAGVSGFQLCFSSTDIHTPGDTVDALVAMNPAALKTNIADLDTGGILIVDEAAFGKQDLEKANYDVNPLEDGSLDGYRVIKIPITQMNRDALKDFDMGMKDKDRCKNMFVLGFVYWLYNRSMEPTLKHLEEKFGKRKPIVAEANAKTLRTGFYFGETTEAIAVHYHVPKAPTTTGRYRKISGNEATAYGLTTAAVLAKKRLVYASYPITPASNILHELAKLKRFNVTTLQAEDEIAAIGAAIGAAFGGSFAVTGTSGPGLALKSEAAGLAAITELPLVIVNVQRGGPSTGLPTKTEQSDLLQAMYGRNGECPIAVVAPATPSDCFHMAQEAFRIAVKFMTPVILMSDGYLANGQEPWLIPDPADLEPIEVKHASLDDLNGDGFLPYKRDEFGARPWAIPGTAGLEHRIGGLEKADLTGNVSYDPDNHERMCHLRRQKIEKIADAIPELEVNGDPSGKLLVLGWGGTYGSIVSAVSRAREEGISVSSAHIKYLNPFPRNLKDVLGSFERVLVPELNLGQLRMLVRDQFLVDAIGLNKLKGQPFQVREIVDKIKELTSN